jgi:hypothetical protein
MWCTKEIQIPISPAARGEVHTESTSRWKGRKVTQTFTEKEFVGDLLILYLGLGDSWSDNVSDFLRLLFVTLF